MQERHFYSSEDEREEKTHQEQPPTTKRVNGTLGGRKSDKSRGFSMHMLTSLVLGCTSVYQKVNQQQDSK